MIEPIFPTEDAKLKDEVQFWKSLRDETKNYILTDLADLSSIGGGLIPEDVWTKLTDETKRKYYMDVLDIKRAQGNPMPYKSSALNFILGHEELHAENIGEAVSAMGLICALLAGIPFSLMSILNGNFYESLRGILVYFLHGLVTLIILYMNAEI